MKYLLGIMLFICVGTSQVYTVVNSTLTLEARASVAGIEDEFDATGTGLTGEIDLNKKTFELRYDLWDLDTGIELRNDHMHENHLETEEYPEAIFKGNILSSSGNEWHIEGTFRLHGVENPLAITVEKSGNQFTAEWKLNLTDYEIEVPRKFLFAKLSEILSLNLVFEIEEK